MGVGDVRFRVRSNPLSLASLGCMTATHSRGLWVLVQLSHVSCLTAFFPTAPAQVLGATGDGKKRQASKAKEAVKQVEAVATKLLESKGSDTGAGARVATCVCEMGVMGESRR